MDCDPHIVWAVGAFVFGAVIGSFLNVVIHRLPLRQSIVFPGSHCPSCERPIRFYDNIPILSYLVLRGRCRECGARISARYPVVELSIACLALGLFARYGFTAECAIWLAFCAAMVAVFCIDLDHMIIPDAISVTGIAAGIILSLLGVIPAVAWKSSLFGAVLGAVILYLPAVLYEKIRGIEGLGGGDVKLLAMIGAFTGPYGVIFVLFLASVVGSVTALVMMATHEMDSTAPIPFGPFLSAAAVLYVFVGVPIVEYFFP